ncbi:AraC family transcriptional regulator [Paraoerskovia sediminicola]|uniref:AraC family transcriptional regulator n=1 Tax=Paraoerskovia sediminicola TaxID=1138587 RepID=A0ABM8G250_9CELL|nr:AraC family transcriptional regulator [Paraoerskovia sediminicola]BDZ42186.1 AraC family transcriptional regulator [Paraoerskovia sediminicola]
MRVLPRPLLTHALKQPTTSHILVTDVGFFPHAAFHGRWRTSGAPQHIVIVCSGGRGICRLPSGTHAVRAGQALVIPAGTAHQYEADQDDPWTIWWMHVTGSAVPELVETMTAGVDGPVLTLGDPPRIVALFETIIRRMEHDETMSSLIAAAGAAWHALALIGADRRATSPDRVDPVEVTLEFLRANVSERVSVPELAAMARLSQSHYAALFRKRVGYGVLEYQTRLRMGIARELLDTTDRPIVSIAQQVGYADPLYFSRQFRKLHSMSPTDYRAHDRG